MSRILVVDDEPSICWGLSRLARTMGLRVDAASSAEQGISLASAVRPDVVLLDVRLPGLDGLSAMKSFRLHIGKAPIIIMTAFGDLSTAVRAVEQGAFEYIVKPFDLAEIRAAIERALRGSAPAGRQRPSKSAVEGLLGRTPVMQGVFKRIALAARSDATVLIQGESGVGKELAARAIHRHSARRQGPFIVANLAAIDPAHAEAELFGHPAGTALGAGHARLGLFGQAEGGILFLKDVAHATPPLQAKLLRALENNEVYPLGGERPTPANIRVISATTCELRERVRSGTFRHDLFLRLATFEILVPPLRERQDDVLLLAEHFAAQMGASPAALAGETLAEMQGRPWCGNVRELQGAIAHALVVATSGAVLPCHLPKPLPALNASGGAPPDESPVVLEQAVTALAQQLLENPAHVGGVYDRFLEEVEPPLLATALNRNGNRCAPAARALGLHRTTLKRKLEHYGIDELPTEP